MKNHKFIFGQKVLYKLRDFVKEQIHVCGLYDSENKTIFIEKNLKGNELKHTILHEEIHAIFDRCGLNQTQHTQDLQEMICENVARFILENYNITDKK